MTCAECTQAASQPRWGCYMAGCKDCQARALAHSPLYFDAAAKATLTPQYRAALALVRDGDETEQAAHKRVREWARRIAEQPALSDTQPADGGREC